MRVPLSWLKDFAPFDGDSAVLAATLDDLGLVVEGVEHIGQGLESIVVARVEEISAIKGADRIRRVVVDAGEGPVEVVCGAWNFAVGDLVPLAPVGAVLPGGMEIARRTMKGVVSNGMLCSAEELGLSDDHEGIMRLGDVDGAAPGRALADVLDIRPDVVFDVAVEANRPDAWSIAGVARDLAARLRLPFDIPVPTPVAVDGPTVEELTSVVVEDTELCPRFTARVLTGVVVGPSPPWLARRITLAGMRPINNVVDVSNYVMLELGQPNHPYDLDRLDGGGLLVRRAGPGESVTTLDGVERTLGTPGPGLGDDGRDCLICDARGVPVGIGGLMGGASSEIGSSTSRVLLETAYFLPMAIARTSKRLNLRTEASARFERGCDPAGIDRAADRFVELLVATGGPSVTVAPGVIDVTGDVPGPVVLSVRPAAVNRLLGTAFDGPEIAGLLAPLGMVAGPPPAGAAGPAGAAEADTLTVTVPTFRPDIRSGSFGEADITEEVARTYGYSRLPRKVPSWPQPGRLTTFQRERRLARDVLVGLGAEEAWTPSMVAAVDNARMGLDGPSVEVANPLVADERFLRRSILPGLLGALAYNGDRRQGDLRLFEVGNVFPFPDDGHAPLDERELLCAVFHDAGDDARTAVAAWWALADALRVDGVGQVAPSSVGQGIVGLHPTRSAWLVTTAGGGGPDGDAGLPGRMVEIGAVGEVDPEVATAFGVAGTAAGAVAAGAGPGPAHVGWLQVDLGLLLDPTVVARRDLQARPVSRYPSSDVDLAFVVDDLVPAAAVADVLAAAGGDRLESIELFDVYRGPSVGDGKRSLAFRLRFCALDHTLTDAEVGERRAACIAAAETAVGATLR